MSKIVIRMATHRDVPRIVELAVESVSQNPLPLVIDRPAIKASIEEIIGSPQHYGVVAEVDGKVVGAVGAHTSPGFWFKRMQCNVLMFYTRTPGAGAAMIRDFTAWMKGRPVIKMAVFCLEPGMDPRIGKLLRRLGYTHEFPSYAYVRGAQ